MILSLTDEKNSTKVTGKNKLSVKAKAEIQWWINNIDNSCHHINISNSDITIYIPMKSLTVLQCHSCQLRQQYGGHKISNLQ